MLLRTLLTFGVFSVSFFLTLSAKVVLPAIFQDHMVLQQSTYVTVWGSANPGEAVAFTASWDETSLTTYADSKGRWLMQVSTPPAGGPYSFQVKGENVLKIEDVWMGEVWLASGQSNMAWRLRQSEGGVEVAKAATDPLIRFFQVQRAVSSTPRFDCKGNWEVSSPAIAPEFSAVAFFFAKKLRTELNVPIGIIHSSWGGTPVEAWTSRKALEKVSDFRNMLVDFDEAVSAYRSRGGARDPIHHQSPGTLYNAMIAPLIPFSIRGAIWYQGEYNTRDPYLYPQLFSTMISSWRADFGNRFPFYYVQIAPFQYPRGRSGIAIREAQRNSLEIARTGMVVTMDIGNPVNIHPKKKKEVGDRLAFWALAKEYGDSTLIYSGPIYDRMEIVEDKIRIFFKHAERGLTIKNWPVQLFEIAGTDRTFYPAKVKVEGATLLVYNDTVKNPKAVRYAFNDADESGLFNIVARLPASSFRTDDWKLFYGIPLIESTYNQASDDFSVSFSYTSSEPHQLHYTLDGQDPTSKSPIYTAPLRIKDASEIKVRACWEGAASEEISDLRLFKNKAMKSQLIAGSKPVRIYPGQGERSMIDGTIGDRVFRGGKWQQFSGEEAEFVLDLGSRQEVSELGVHMMSNPGANMLYPTSIRFTYSQNGRKFKSLKTLQPNVGQKGKGVQAQWFRTKVKTTRARYVKITLVRPEKMPDWHKAAGTIPSLSLSEIWVD